MGLRGLWLRFAKWAFSHWMNCGAAGADNLFGRPKAGPKHFWGFKSGWNKILLNTRHMNIFLDPLGMLLPKIPFSLLKFGGRVPSGAVSVRV